MGDSSKKERASEEGRAGEIAREKEKERAREIRSPYPLCTLLATKRVQSE